MENLRESWIENQSSTYKYGNSQTPTISTEILAEKRSPYQIENDLSDVQKPIISAPPEVRQIIERVLEIEKDKLYMKSPRYISDDILKIIKEAVI
ncbi:hypothetical protein [Microcoleus sp. EPA2]|jgi:hypothetical protein|uniref:hypothetical protein n=1 Tax=Microcoleus sp. EPA2 TaxID=2841654 RepID=UPI00312B53F1